MNLISIDQQEAAAIRMAAFYHESKGITWERLTSHQRQIYRSKSRAILMAAFPFSEIEERL